MWSKLDCGEVEDEKTRNGYLQKRRAGSVRARDVRVLDTTGAFPDAPFVSCARFPDIAASEGRVRLVV